MPRRQARDARGRFVSDPFRHANEFTLQLNSYVNSWISLNNDTVVTPHIPTPEEEEQYRAEVERNQRLYEQRQAAERARMEAMGFHYEPVGDDRPPEVDVEAGRHAYVQWDGYAQEWQVIDLVYQDGYNDWQTVWTGSNPPNIIKSQFFLPPGMKAPESGCNCEGCRILGKKKMKKEPKEISHHGYNPGWQFKDVRRGPRSRRPLLYMGVELETDRPDISLDPEVVNALSAPDGFWEGTEDSSISGIEFVSHPATLSYWRMIRPSLEAMFKRLIHVGYRSHQNDTCGMHVSFSAQAIKSREHLSNLCHLIYGKPDWSRTVSQRTNSSESDWASLRPLAKVNGESWSENLDTYDEMLDILHNDEWPEDWRYVALNRPMGEGRYEFRLPRGTLRIDRFFKNLEWVAAMIEATETTRHTPLTFQQWVSPTKYPYLSTFLAERFPTSHAQEGAA